MLILVALQIHTLRCKQCIPMHQVWCKGRVVWMQANMSKALTRTITSHACPCRYACFVACFPGVVSKLAFVLLSHAAFFILHLQASISGSPADHCCNPKPKHDSKSVLECFECVRLFHGCIFYARQPHHTSKPCCDPQICLSHFACPTSKEMPHDRVPWITQQVWTASAI